MPMKTTQTAAMLTHHDLESSGSDFGFTDDEDDDNEYDGGDYYEDELNVDDEDEEEYDDDFSGSGDQSESSQILQNILNPHFN